MPADTAMTLGFYGGWLAAVAVIWMAVIARRIGVGWTVALVLVSPRLGITILLLPLLLFGNPVPKPGVWLITSLAYIVPLVFCVRYWSIAKKPFALWAPSVVAMAIYSASPPDFPKHETLHFRPSANEFCHQSVIPDPYGLTTMCATVSDDQMHLLAMTISTGDKAVRVPDSVLAKVDRPLLDTFVFTWDVYGLDFGRSYVECEILFGGPIEGEWTGRGIQPYARRKLILKLRDAGSRVEYLLEDTDKR